MPCNELLIMMRVREEPAKKCLEPVLRRLTIHATLSQAPFILEVYKNSPCQLMKEVTYIRIEAEALIAWDIVEPRSCT